MRRVVVSARARDRLDAAIAWLKTHAPSSPVRVVAPTYDTAAALVRSATDTATFGWQKATPGSLAFQLARPELVRRRRTPAGTLALQAVARRVVDELGPAGLGRFAPVADAPGLALALCSTLLELRAAGSPRVDPDLDAIADLFADELARHGIADRVEILELATAAVSAGPPLLLLDVPVRDDVEGRFLRALADASPAVLATAPPDEPRLAEALGVEPDVVEIVADSTVRRVQRWLFSPTPPPEAELDEGLTLLSAPGESRECVEIVRLVHAEAAAGVPFERMAILVRAAELYRAPLVEALRRGDVPAFVGTRLPDPSGRAFLALLDCVAEGLSARAFAEYLSLGELPDDAAGAPPPSRDLFVVAEEEWLDPIELELDDVEGDSDGSVVDGVLAAPLDWEELLVDAAVIGGLDRWERRLGGLDAQLAAELRGMRPEDPRRLGLVADRRRLAHLRGFALPLLAALDALPDSASWGEWLEGLGALATRSLRRPERVLAVLSELRPMAPLGPVPLADVRALLRPRLVDLQQRPSGKPAGKVFVGPIESARGQSFDVVFVPGLAERLFPQKVTEDPVLLDLLRTAPLRTNVDRTADERRALRLAVGAAERRLVLSWPRLDLSQGRPRVPSFYGLEVLRAAEGSLPGFEELVRRATATGRRAAWPAPTHRDDAIDEAEHDLVVLDGLLHQPEARAAGWGRYLIGANPHLARALRTRARRWSLTRFTPADGLFEPDAAAVEALRHHQLDARSWSPTALQHFAACPYRFLLYTVHRLRAREEPVAVEALDPLSRGSLFHEVLYALHTELRDAGSLPVTDATHDAVRDRLDALLDEHAATYEAELAPAVDRVWRAGIEELRADLREWLRRASQVTDPVPWRFELAFGLPDDPGHDAHSTREPVTLANGLRLRGSIDLVERGSHGLRATDYKTGRSYGARGMVVRGGTLLQPVLYAMALEALLGTEVWGGRLYYCTSRGRYSEVEVPLNADARKAVDQIATALAHHLEQGVFPAAPAKGACKWCDYRAVCGPHEELRASRKNPEPLARIHAIRKLP